MFSAKIGVDIEMSDRLDDNDHQILITSELVISKQRLIEDTNRMR